MKSVDTNVLIRLLTEDDPIQTPKAKAVLSGPVYIADGVLMEAEWVLRSRYRWKRDRINTSLTQMIRLENICVSDRAALLWCFARHRERADLADMLHIVASRETAAFLTFESELIDEAGPDAPLPIEQIA